MQLLRPGHHGTSECGLNTSSIGLVGGVAGWSWQAATPAFGRSARPKATSLQKLAEKRTRALKKTLSETWPRRLISLQAPTPSLLRAEGSERTPKHEELFRFSLSVSLFLFSFSPLSSSLPHLGPHTATHAARLPFSQQLSAVESGRPSPTPKVGIRFGLWAVGDG